MIGAVLQSPVVDGGLHIQACDELLSSRLRAATEEMRRRAESRLGPPDAVADRAGLVACVQRLLCFYGPLEARLSQYGQWAISGVDLIGLSAAARLRRTLMEFAPCPDERLYAPREVVPHLPTFAHALGGVYAMVTFTPALGCANSGLGESRLYGCEIGEQASCRGLEEALDRHGVGWPASIPLAIEGAQRTFEAMGRWMVARHWRLGHGADGSIHAH